jgi:hypothetical protein
MSRKTASLRALLLLAPLLSRAHTQTPTGSAVHVEFVNSTFYIRGYCAASEIGKDTSKLPVPASVPALTTGIGIADIVSVNGQPAKGAGIEVVNGALLGPAILPGRAIADFAGGPTNTSWELTFMNLDDTLIGTLQIEGHGNGRRPPDAPKEITGSAYTVTAGTGAFFGVRGYFQPVQDTVSGERRTTVCEDPAYRRVNADSGGNKRHPDFVSRPDVYTASNRDRKRAGDLTCQRLLSGDGSEAGDVERNSVPVCDRPWSDASGRRSGPAVSSGTSARSQLAS